MYYLYLLPFQNKEFFKIGISSNGFSRIQKLNSLYHFSLDEALIIIGNKKSISSLEKFLLAMCEGRILEYEGQEGWTEIRYFEHWDRVINSLDNLTKMLGLKITNYKSHILALEKQSKEKKGIAQRPPYAKVNYGRLGKLWFAIKGILPSAYLIESSYSSLRVFTNEKLNESSDYSIWLQYSYYSGCRVGANHIVRDYETNLPGGVLFLIKKENGREELRTEFIIYNSILNRIQDFAIEKGIFKEEKFDMIESPF